MSKALTKMTIKASRKTRARRRPRARTVLAIASAVLLLVGGVYSFRRHTGTGQRRRGRSAIRRPPPTLLAPVVRLQSRESVVMGYAVGYKAKHIQNFLYSLRNTGYSGAIVLGMGPRTKWDRDMPRLLRSVNASTRLVHPDDGGASSAVQMRRFSDYASWLVDFAPSSPVLVTDVRDVVFQADPLAPERFHAHLAVDESEAAGALLFGQGLTFKQELSGNNLHWVRRCWSDLQDAAFWDDKMLINSGVIMGTAAGVRAVARAMTAEATATKCKGSGGSDQGVLNRLVYGSSGRLRVMFAGNGASSGTKSKRAAPLVKVFADIMDGPVSTIGSLKYLSRDENLNAVLLRDAAGFILHRRAPTSTTTAGGPPVYERVPVVHQWERFLSLLGDWVDRTLARKGRWLCPPEPSDAHSDSTITAWRCSCVGMAPHATAETYMRCPQTCYRPVERRTAVVRPFYRATLRDKCTTGGGKTAQQQKQRQQRLFVDEASGAAFDAGSRLCTAKSWWQNRKRIAPWDQNVPDWYHNTD